MAVFNVKKGFGANSDTELIDRADNVVTQMTGNINFVTPDPPLADLTTAKNNFSAAYMQVYNGNLTYKPLKKSTRDTLIFLLTREAKYVEFTGQNVETKLASSGFEIYDTAISSAPASDVPVVKYAKDTGIVGKIKLQLKKVQHAVVYEIRHTQDENLATARWTHLVCQTRTQFEITDLTPGVENWFEARSISTKGPSGWSDPFRFRPR